MRLLARSVHALSEFVVGLYNWVPDTVFATVPALRKIAVEITIIVYEIENGQGVFDIICRNWLTRFELKVAIWSTDYTPKSHIRRPSMNDRFYCVNSWASHLRSFSFLWISNHIVLNYYKFIIRYASEYLALKVGSWTHWKCLTWFQRRCHCQEIEHTHTTAHITKKEASSARSRD